MPQTWRQYLAQLSAPQPDRDAPRATQPQNLLRNVVTPLTGVGSNRPNQRYLSGQRNQAATPSPTGYWGQPVVKPAAAQVAAQTAAPTSPFAGLSGYGWGVTPNAPQPSPSGGQEKPKAPNPVQEVPDEQLGLPLSPEFEAGRRAIEDALAAELAAVGRARAEIPTMLEFIKARLANDEAESLRQVDEAMNARGLFNSGIRGTGRAKQSMGYDRTRQDVAMDAGRQLSELAGRESGARMNYSRDLAGLLMAIANAQAQDDRTAVSTPTEDDTPGNGKKPGDNKPKGGKNKPKGDGKQTTKGGKRGKNKGRPQKGDYWGSGAWG